MYDIEKKRATYKRWYDAHKNEPALKEYKSRYRKKYYYEHREEELEKCKAYKLEHPEKVKEWARISRQRAKIKGLF